MRLLGAVRLSRDTDDTTSPERQRELITAYAAANGHTVVHITEDLDVSGALAPAERPELGPWLRRPSEWDGLIAAKPDRVSRSLRDFLNFHHELAGQGKTLITLDPALDFSTPMGRFVAQVLLAFAELERGMIAGRTRDAHQHIKNGAGYPGGQVPFGYTVVKREGKGWAYAHDPQYAPVVREMAERVLGGQSMRQVSLWLNAAGVPTSRNLLRRRRGKPEDPTSVWRTETVRAVLHSPAIAGLHARDGRPLRDGEGVAVQRCEGIITRAEWEQVKASSAGPAHRAHRVDANPLLRVAYCTCGAPLYATARRDLRYYRCSRWAECRSRTIPAPLLEEAAATLFLADVGGLEVLERVEIPGEDHAQEIAELEAALHELEADMNRGTVTPTAYVKLAAPLETRREALAAIPSRPASHEMVPTGETFAARWDELEAAGRRRLMAGATFRVMAGKEGSGSVFVMSLADEELAGRVRAVGAGQHPPPVPWPETAASLGMPLRGVLYPGIPIPAKEES